MTPKQKADELIEKFSPHCYCFLGSGMLTNTQNDRVQLMNAIQCAIIAVDEAIQSNTNVTGSVINGDYWQEVKSELEKQQ